MMEIYLHEVPNTDFYDQFEFVEKLASGAFGNVIRAIDKKSNQEVAVKILHKEIDKHQLNLIRQEINIFQNLNHKNIVKFLGCMESNTQFFVAMDLLKGGTIKSLIENRKNIFKNLSEEECSLIMKQLLEAVKYLHDREIVHRDIKPENMLIDENDKLKISDFGVSHIIENGSDEI